MSKNSSRAVDVKLLVRAGNALIAWRRNWERICCEPPSTTCGHHKFVFRLWIGRVYHPQSQGSMFA